MDNRTCDICYSDTCDTRCKQIKSFARDLYDADHLTIKLVQDLCNLPFENKDALQGTNNWRNDKYNFSDDLQEAVTSIERHRCVFCGAKYKKKDEALEACGICDQDVYSCGGCPTGWGDYQALCKKHLDKDKAYDSN